MQVFYFVYCIFTTVITNQVKMMMLLVLNLLFSAAVSVDHNSSPEELAEAKRKITESMAESIQNNVELRKILIGKCLDEKDLVCVVEQYTHIARIQTNKFGADSAEVADARQEAEIHVKNLAKQEQAEFDAWKPGNTKKDIKLVEKKNLLVMNAMARMLVAKGSKEAANQLYEAIAQHSEDRFGSGSPQHVAALSKVKSFRPPREEL